MIRNSRLKKRSLFTRPPQRKAPKKPLIRYILVTAFRRMLMAFGAMFLISMISVFVLLSTLVEHKGPPIYPNEFVLDLAIEGDFSEYHMVSGPLGDHRPAFRDVVDIIDAATADSRVKGLLVRLDGRMTNIAQIQELRSAIRRFRDSGRFAHIYSTSYGGLGQGMGSYYLASAFDEIWMQPVGVVSIPGVRAEVPFVKGALDKVGVEPQFFARKEYKSVFESFTSYEMSAESREMLQERCRIVVDVVADADERERRIVAQDGGQRLAEHHRIDEASVHSLATGRAVHDVLGSGQPGDQGAPTGIGKLQVPGTGDDGNAV